MICHLFEVAVTLYTVFDKNNALFSSVFNYRFNRKSQFVAFTVGGEASYGAVFDINDPLYYNTSVSSREEKLQELPILRKLTSTDNTEDMMHRNALLVDRNFKELSENDISKPLGSQVPETTDSETFNEDMYSKVIHQHLFSVSQLGTSLQKLKESEV